MVFLSLKNEPLTLPIRCFVYREVKGQSVWHISCQQNSARSEASGQYNAWQSNLINMLSDQLCNKAIDKDKTDASHNKVVESNNEFLLVLVSFYVI